MPAGQVIGRVSVKVIPDSDDFRADAKRQLDRIEQQLGPIKIKAELDLSGLKRDMLNAIRDINAENKADSRKIRFLTTISKDGMAETVREAARDLQLRADEHRVKFDADVVTGKVKLDLDKSTAQRVKGQLDRFRRDHSPIRVAVAISEVADSIKTALTLDKQTAERVKKQLGDFADKNSPLAITVEPDLSATGSLLTSARLGVLTRPRTVSVVPEVNGAAAAKVGTALAALSGARVLGSLFDGVADALSGLDRSVPLIGTLATAVAGIAGLGLTAASNLFAISASLAAILPAAFLLPGLFGGLALGIGATVAVFKDAGKVFPDVSTKLAVLRKAMSGDFWSAAQKPIRNLIDTLLPQFSAGMLTTSRALGKFFAGLASALTSSFDGVLAGMFAALGQSITIFSGATGALANIIKVLGQVGASALPALAGYMADLVTRFSDFLTRAQTDGSLQQWIAAALVGISDLGRIVGNVVGVFASLTSAATAAGGAGLGQLADTLGVIRGAVSTPEFKSGLVSVLLAAHAAMSQIGTISGPAVLRFFGTIGATLASILPAVGATIGLLLSSIATAFANPILQTGIKALFDGILAAVIALAPAIPPLGAAFGALAAVLGAFLTTLGPTIAATFTAISAAALALLPSVQLLIPYLGQGLSDALSILGSALRPVLSAFIAFAPTLARALDGFNPLGPIILAAAAAFVVFKVAVAAVSFVKLISETATAIASMIRFAATAVATAATSSAAWVASVSQTVAIMALYAAQAVANGTRAAVAWAASVAQSVAAMARYAVASATSAATAAASWAAGIARTVAQFAIVAASAVTQGAAVAAAWVASSARTVASLAVTTTAFIAQGARQVASMAVTAAAIVASWVLMAVQSLAQAARMAAAWLIAMGPIGIVIAAVVGLAVIIYKNWDSIVAATTAAWNAVSSFISNAVSTVVNFVRTNWQTLLALLTGPIGLAVGLIVKHWAAITAAFSGGVERAAGFVRSLPGKITAAFGNAGSILVGAGKQIISGLISGITSKFGEVQAKLASLTSKLPDWKGPAQKDGRLLYHAGQLIIDGLNAGLESRFSKVKQLLNDLTSLIPKNASAALKATIANDRTQLLALASQWDKAADRVKDAMDRLDDLRKQSADYSASVAENILGRSNIAEMEDTSFDAIIRSLNNARAEAAAFADVLGKLKNAGLGDIAIDQIAKAGPKALGAATSILNAGKANIAALNSIQGEIAAYAKKAGDTASSALFDQGIQVAQGFVKGLEQGRNAIEDQMTRIAQSMVGVIKRELGIHSPSRVMRDLAQYVPIGIAKGVQDEARAVTKAMGSISSIVATADIQPPEIGRLTAAVSGSLADGGTSGSRIFNYYAAPGSSLGAEEDLFAAAGRSRMVGW